MMYYNEMLDGQVVCVFYVMLLDWVEIMFFEIWQMKQVEVEVLFCCIGIIFVVYGEGGDLDWLILFDMMLCVFL